jgi:DNA-binding HxlR family transcriptional regulator
VPSGAGQGSSRSRADRSTPPDERPGYSPWLERFTHATFVHEEEFGSARAPLLSREHHQWTPLARALLAIGDQWTLLIVAALAHGPQRLTGLRTHLPGISTGVLDRHLQQMVDLGLVSRQRYRELPPRVEYRLTPAGLELVPVVVQLARWGIQHMWTKPQPREHVAIGELLRLLPAMLADKQLPDGTVELVVEERKGRDRYVFEIEDGHLDRIEPGAIKLATRMAGEPYDWVDALGPKRNYAALRVTGDLALARRLLKALLG